MTNFITADNRGWWKTDLAAPFTAFFAFKAIRVATGGFNPITGLMISTVASFADILGSAITNGSQENSDLYFRYAVTILAPLAIGMCLGMPFVPALIMTIANLGIRLLIYEFFFQENGDHSDDAV